MLLNPVVNPVHQEFPAVPVIPVVPVYAVVLALVVQVVPLRVLVVPRDPVIPGETGGARGREYSCKIQVGVCDMLLAILK